jgi:hypothetical protein
MRSQIYNRLTALERRIRCGPDTDDPLLRAAMTMLSTDDLELLADGIEAQGRGEAMPAGHAEAVARLQTAAASLRDPAATRAA